MPEDLNKLRIERREAAPGAGKRRRRRLPVWALIAAGLIILLGVLWTTGVLRPAREVETAVVSLTYPSEGYTLVNASGYVVAQRQANVASKGTGRLEYLGVEEGSRVKRGEIIARLESDDFKARREEAAARLGVARSQLAQAQAELSDARLNYDRRKTLVEKGFVPRAEFDAAQARLDTAVAAERLARSQIAASEAALRAAEVEVEYTLIRAPFDGVVLTKNADVGEVVAPLASSQNTKAAVVTMADMGSLEVEADVSESNLGKVRAGQSAEIQLDALPGVRMPGRVHMIVPTADRAKATVLTKVRFEKPDPRVLPEMSAKVAFLSRPVGADEKPLLTVPQAALLPREGRTIALVVREGRAHEVAVKTGRKLGSLVEVLGGLKEGERVVLRPQGLPDGAKVKVAGE
jgi:RND family efflux transporter MFP subunit